MSLRAHASRAGYVTALSIARLHSASMSGINSALPAGTSQLRDATGPVVFVVPTRKTTPPWPSWAQFTAPVANGEPGVTGDA